MITPASIDANLAGYFKIISIGGGTLYLNNGTTAVAAGSYITFAQGQAGLKFRPSTNSTASGSVVVQASTTNADSGLGGTRATASITVNAVPVLTSPGAQSTTEDTGLTFSSAGGNAITLSDPGAPGVTAQLTLSATDGTLSLASTSGLTFVSGANGSTSMSVLGTLTSLNAALNGAVFTPSTHYVGTQASLAVTDSEGSNSTSATIAISVNATAHTPSISNATTNENAQSSSGLVITPNALDGFVGYVQITSIAGGALYQHDGVTAITSGQYITFAQGEAGLRFTPVANSVADGSFYAQSSTLASVLGLSGGLAAGEIAVNPVPVVTAPATATLIEDATTTFSSTGGNAVTFSDPGNSAGAATVTLAASAGTLTLPTTSGLVFTSGANGSSSLTFSGTFSSLNSALDGLSFTPALHASGSASVSVTATEGANSASRNIALTITRVVHTPTVAAASTVENTQSNSGLVITRNTLDAGMSGYYQITSISGGTLFQNDGVTPIASGSFITFVQGQAGLKFTPAADSIASGSFVVQSSASSSSQGLAGSTTSATVTVTPRPLVSVPATQTTLEDASTTLSIANGNAIRVNDAGNPGGTATLSLTATAGAISLASLSGITLSAGSGANDTSVTFTGTFAAINNALDGLIFTPSAATFGSAAIAASAAEGANTSSANLSINVTRTAHTPSVSAGTTNENTQSSSGLVITPAGPDVGLGGYYKITGISGGSLFQGDDITAISNGSFISFAQGQAGLRFTPGANSIASGSFSIQASTTNSDAGLGGSAISATVDVNPIPVVSVPVTQSTKEDTAFTFSTAGGNALGVSDAGNPSGVVQLALTTSNGAVTLAGTSGVTVISGANGSSNVTVSGTFSAIASALNGLRFTPASNYYGSGALLALTATEGSNSASSTVAITVARTAHSPTISTATANENQQSTAGLVITPSALDAGLSGGFFKITAIANGALFQNDGITPIGNGSFLTFAQGQAELRFTPGANSTAPGSFSVQASTSAGDAGLSGSTIGGTISVNPVPVVSVPVSQSTMEDTALMFSAARGNALAVSDPGSPGGVVQLAFSAANGTVTLASTSGITLVSGANGSSSVTVSGTFAAVAAALDGLSFLPALNYHGSGASLSLTATEGSNVATGAVAVSIVRAAHTPTVSAATTNENQQSTSGLIVSPSALDAGLNGFFKVTAIAGGTLYQHDGLTPISAGSFITFAQGQSGLRFTPSANSTVAGSFVVQSSTSNSDAGLGGATVTASITVNPVPMVNVPGGQTVIQGMSVTLSSGNGNAISVSDPGNPGGTATVSFAAQYGTVTIPSLSGLTIVSGSNGSASLSVSGSLTALNAAIDGLVYTASSTHNGSDGQLAVSVSEGANAASATIAINITPAAHTPSVTGATTNENQQSASGLVISPNPLDASGYLQITSISNGSLFQHDGITPINNGDFLTFAQGQAGLRFTPTSDSSSAGSFAVQTSSTSSSSGLAGQQVVANIVVQPVPVLAAPAARSTLEDTPITFSTAQGNAVVVSDPGNGGATVQVSLSAGAGTLTLASASGLTIVSGADNTGAVTFSGSIGQVNTALDGLVYTPLLQVSGADTLSISASEGMNSASQTVALTVTRVAHTPNATNSSTNENVQSATGLTLFPSSFDSGMNGYFKITGVTGGALFQHDGATPVNNGDFITFAQGQAGLRFSPASNSTTAGQFTAQASTSSSDAGLGGGVVQANITVRGVPQTSVIGSQIVSEDTSLLFSNAAGNALTVGDPGAPSATVQVTLGATHGTVSLGSASGITLISGSGAEDTSVTFTGSINAANAALEGASYTPALHYSGAATLTLAATEGSNSTSGQVAVTVARVAHTPSVSDAATFVNQQTGSGLVISPGTLDNGLNGYFKLTSITGGTLYLNDGITLIASSGFITFAQGQAGLRFTPSVNSTAAGSFSVQASTSSSDSGLGGSIVSAHISVDDPPHVVVSGPTLNYTEDQGQAPLDAGLTLTDSDSANLVSASIRVLGYAAGEDSLQYADQNGIVGSWNAQTATLTLTGTASVSDYQSALRSITYLNSSRNPSTLPRTVQFSAHDATAFSSVVSRNLEVTAVNDPPVLSVPGSQSGAEDSVFIFSTSRGNALSVSDIDAGTGDEQVTVSATNATVRSADGTDWQSSITLTGTLSQLNTALDGLAVRPASHSVAPVTVEILAKDLGHSGSNGALTASASVILSLVPTSIVINAGSVVLGQQLATTIGPQALQTTRMDGTTPFVTYSVVAAPAHGSLALSGNPLASGDTFTQQDIVAGRLQYVPADPSRPLADTFSVSATDSEGATAGPTMLRVETPAPLPAILITPQTHVPASVPNAPQSAIPLQLAPESTPAGSSGSAAGSTNVASPTSAADSDATEGGKASSGSAPHVAVTVTAALLNGNVVSGVVSRVAAPIIELGGVASGKTAAQVNGVDTSLKLDFANGYNDTLGDLTARRRDRFSLSGSRAPAVATDSELWRALDTAHDRITSTTPARIWAGSASFVSVGMSVVYFIWALRAGSLVSSLLSSMPAWKMVDPLPILEHGSEALALNTEDQDDRALSDLVKGND